jgi:hypothetical protein
MRITKKSMNLQQLSEYYQKNLQEIRNEVYYQPRILVTALTGSGKSTLISKLVPKNMGAIFQSIVGNIRTTACTVQYYFDPSLSSNLLTFSASKKVFNEISDKIVEISMKELANMLVDDSKSSKDNEAIIRSRLFDHIFISNNSLFDFDNLLSKSEIEKVTSDIYSIFCIFKSSDFVQKAKSPGKSSSKDATLKNKVEDLCFDDFATNTEVQNIFTSLLDFLKAVIDEKIKAAFNGIEDSTNLVMCFDTNEDGGSEKASSFIKKIFGVPDIDKGLQFFLENVIIHLSTYDDYDREDSFVIIDTQGIDHEGNDPRIVADSLLSIINSNRISELLYLSTFTSDYKVLKVIEDALTKIKKPLNIRVCLTKFDEYVSKETVQILDHGDDEMDDEEYKQFINSKVVEPSKDIINQIRTDIKDNYSSNSCLNFSKKISRFSFARNPFVPISKVADVYNLIGEILDRIQTETKVVAVKRKPGVDYDDLIGYNIDDKKLSVIINDIIASNSFIKSLKVERNKNVYWSSVYCLKRAIRKGSGHKTHARVYTDFAIFPAPTIDKSISSNIDNLLSAITFDFSNITDSPANLESVIKDNICKEIVADSTRIMALNLTYTEIKSEFESFYPHYKVWWESLFDTYYTNLNSVDYWNAILKDVLVNVITKKIQTSISVN